MDSAAKNHDRVAIVTGAGKGLGAAFATRLAEDGCGVVVNNRTHPGVPSSASIIAQKICESGGEAIAEGSAVDDPKAAKSLIETAINTYGRLDVLVLNAGISGPAARVDSDQDKKTRSVMEINFFSNVALIEAALPHLMASDAGRILLIASSAGLYGVRGRAAYAASKGALIAYGQTLADELRRTKIRVNMLAPYAATAMTATEDGAADPRLDPEKTTAAALYLCRPECERSGEIWLAGADYYARAATVEGVGGAVCGASADAFARAVDPLADLSQGQEFSGAQAAFADFMRRASSSMS